MALFKFIWWLILFIIKVNIFFVILTYFAGIYELLNDKEFSENISLWDIIQGFISEIFASLLNLLTFPLSFFNIENLFTSKGMEPKVDSPVLLIHPYFGSSATVWFYFFKFKKAGFENTFTINLRPRTGSIRTFLDQIDGRCEEIITKTGKRKVALVGHSMGGLLARLYAMENKEKVSCVVTVGSPHSGSKLAVFGIGKCAREMEQNSELMREIENKFPDVPFLSIYSPVDNLAVPQRTAIVPEREERVNYKAPPLGHLALLYSPSVSETIISFVRSKSL